MKKFVRPAAWTTALLVIAGLVFVALRPSPILVDTATVRTGHLQVTVDEDGLTRIRERYVVSTPLAGRLQRITLEVGDPVVAETTALATMQATDPSLLDPRDVARAQARVNAAQNRLDAARTELTQVNTDMEYALSELERVRALKETQAASEEEFERKEQSYRRRIAEQKTAAFAVSIAEYELELERAALLLTDQPTTDGDRAANADEMQLTIMSPIHGRVLRISQESTAVLAAGAELMVLGDPLDLEVVIDVLSMDAVRVTEGDRVQILNWGGERPLEGRVRVIEPSGFTKISALGVEEQRVNVVVDLLDAPDDRAGLGDGFRIDARIIVWEADEARIVPTSALFRSGEDWALFTVSASGRAQMRTVSIDQTNGVEALITDGIDVGERVIVHPSDKISEGVLVDFRTGAT